MAQRQMGVISAAQALGTGLTRQQISYRRRSGTWSLVMPRVFAFAGAPSSWLQRIYAAHLSLGPHAVFSGLTAAALLGVEEFRAEKSVHLIVTRGLRPARSWIELQRVTELGRRDVSAIDALPVTTAPRTLLDVAGRLPPAVVERTLSTLLHKRLVTMPALEDQLLRNGRRGRRGTALFRKLVEARAGEPGIAATGFEVDLFALLKKAGFPHPLQQFEVWHEGRFVARPDFCYPERMIIIEADSYRWHSNPEQWRREQTRHNQLIALGWAVLRFTWADLPSPHEFLSNLRRAWERNQPAA
ncbi:MAG: hypothetical protein ACRDJV_01740 [Actinomycetota bacterium]